MLAYEARYETLDAYSYHELAVGSSVQFDELAWGRSTQLITWLLQCLYELTPPSYHLAKVIFSFVGLVGIYLTWRALVALTGKERLQHLYLLGLFPSLLFWSSIIGKDPILVLLVGMYVLGVARLQQSRYATGLLLAFAAAISASLIRSWMGAILLLPLIAALAVQFSKAQKPLTILAVSATITVVLPAVVFEAFGIDVGSFVQSIDDVSKSWDEGGSAQTAPEFGSLSHVVAFAPLSAFTASVSSAARRGRRTVRICRRSRERGPSSCLRVQHYPVSSEALAMSQLPNTCRCPRHVGNRLRLRLVSELGNCIKIQGANSSCVAAITDSAFAASSSSYRSFLNACTQPVLVPISDARTANDPHRLCNHGAVHGRRRTHAAAIARALGSPAL